MKKTVSILAAILCLALGCVSPGSGWALLGAAGGAFAASLYYVSPEGDDSYPGTSSQPWKTLQHAADQVTAGDDVVIRSGTYAGFRSASAGMAGAPISFRAETGAAAVVNSPGPSAEHGSNIEIEGHDWWIIEGLEITGATLAGVDVREAAHVTVRRCWCHHNGRWGIFTGFADWFTAEENECSYSGAEHGIYASNSGDYNVIRRNACHHNHACGVQLNADPSMGGDGIMSQAVIEDNVVYGNGEAGGAAINLASVRDSLIANNLIYGNSSGGIAGWDDDQGGEWGCKNNKIFNNTVHMPASARWALNLVNGSTGNAVKNNILIHEGAKGGLETDSSSLAGTESDYNIMARASVDDSGMSLSEWQTAYSQDIHSTVQTAAATFSDPGFDYQLRETSFARDHGVALPEVTDDLAGNPRPVGPAPDLGCYEYVPSADLNADGRVDSRDLGILMSLWGSSGPTADINADGAVDGGDLAILLGQW